MPVNMSLFLQNVSVALANKQYSHAQFLLTHAINLASESEHSLPRSLVDVSLGLHPGRVRVSNEDSLLAVQGVMPRSHESFGLFVVCDGIGGHSRGQEASHLAIQTILEYVLPFLEADNHAQARWGHLLAESIHLANRAIYLRNQQLEQGGAEKNTPIPQQSREAANATPSHHMGTTVTSVLLIGQVAYIANVGDSRTYVYDQSLHKITKDHSLVAEYIVRGLLKEEEIYTHPQRNQITRSLGIQAHVEVDSFILPLRGRETLLLCSDGLWEMTRDRKIEEILSSSWSNASSISTRLVEMANNGGGSDNIGCIVIQLQRRIDISSIETMTDGSIAALTKLLTPSL